MHVQADAKRGPKGGELDWPANCLAPDELHLYVKSSVMSDWLARACAGRCQARRREGGGAARTAMWAPLWRPATAMRETARRWRSPACSSPPSAATATAAAAARCAQPKSSTTITHEPHGKSLRVKAPRRVKRQDLLSTEKTTSSTILFCTVKYPTPLADCPPTLGTPQAPSLHSRFGRPGLVASMCS